MLLSLRFQYTLAPQPISIYRNLFSLDKHFEFPTCKYPQNKFPVPGWYILAITMLDKGWRSLFSTQRSICFCLCGGWDLLNIPDYVCQNSRDSFSLEIGKIKTKIQQRVHLFAKLKMQNKLQNDLFQELHDYTKYKVIKRITFNASFFSLFMALNCFILESTALSIGLSDACPLIQGCSLTQTKSMIRVHLWNDKWRSSYNWWSY